MVVNVIIGNAIRGRKDTKWMLYTQILGTAFTITISALMIFIFHLGLLGVFVTILFDETFRSIINFLRFYKGKEFFFKFVKFKSEAG